jgi:hypothetical protein
MLAQAIPIATWIGEKNHFVDKSNFSCILDMSHLRDDVYKNRSIFLIKAIKILFISGIQPPQKNQTTSGVKV